MTPLLLTSVFPWWKWPLLWAVSGTLAAAIAGGCELVVVPEVEFSREDLVNEIKTVSRKVKKHAIVAISTYV